MKGWGGRILLLVLALAVSFAGAEIALRLFAPQPLNLLYVRRDGVLSHVPNADALQVGIETRARVRTNRDGLRDVERPRAKPPGAWRVLVLGDSMVEGLQVDLPRTMPKQLERILARALPGTRPEAPRAAGARADFNARSGAKRVIDVINAGVSGSTGPDAARYLEREGLSYEPDVVVVTFTARNDVDEAAAARPARPPLYEVKTFLRSRYHLYGLLERAVNEQDWLRTLLSAAGLVAPPDPFRYRGAPGAVNQEAFHYDEVMQDWEARGYDRLFASYDAILRMCRPRGIPVAFVLLPSYYQVTRSPRALGDPERVRAIVRDDREPQDRLIAFLANRRAAVIDLLPAARARGAALYLPQDQHFSAAGNAFAARETARVILEKGWLAKTD
jgi:lysophospholipase L1-like esterase